MVFEVIGLFIRCNVKTNLLQIEPSPETNHSGLFLYISVYGTTHSLFHTIDTIFFPLLNLGSGFAECASGICANTIQEGNFHRSAFKANERRY